MKITLLTSNNVRHNYLINLLSEVSDELFVIQECRTIFPGFLPGFYQTSPIIKKYFENVNKAQSKLFGSPYINIINKNIKILPIISGDLNQCSMNLLSDFLKSDLYVVFGSSYIKGDLVDFLIKQKALNIHAGVSPYYRGTDCNFWALFNDNPHLVGTTIHLLSKGLDNGPILYHAMSTIKTNPFEYTMSTVKSSFHSIAQRIKDNSIFKIKPVVQNKNQEVRYSTKNEFNEKVVKDFFAKKIDLNFKEFDYSLLKDPFYIKDIE
jgi:hypothetical protein